MVDVYPADCGYDGGTPLHLTTSPYLQYNIKIYFKVVRELIYNDRSEEHRRRDLSHPGAAKEAPHPKKG